ncbi:hypothetical protein CSC2_44090 [Clostridium zeae]|uniref:histidine kinase n=1 Tax=Clostridium zeae TaxID=2759022 RepID=A0ABQ1EGU5_9CLOT|nr:HAMP domain-containing sensor histidine kinase [Clostridium zeae]GFZ33883.1 hypothetical protein CSC2_44090 [Clostridium zeae]
MLKDSETVISSNADILSNYIESMKSIDNKNFNNINLSSGIYYIVYDENKDIIFSNTENSVQITDRRQNRKLRNKDSFEKLNGTISTSRVVDVKGKIYYIVVTKDFEDIGEKIGYIAEILFTISILGIIVSLISGNFLSKKLLRPIKDITKTAKEITSKSLSKRIVTNGAKDEISDLADTFNLMIERLEVDFDKQKRFVSDASHELRTPLAVIHGHVNMLYRWGKNDSEQLDKSLITLKSETENMNKLIENLLYLAKGDNDVLSIKKEEFTIASLFKEIVEETELSHNNVEITYNSYQQLKVYADYSKLKQVLRILIDNSIKFSKASAQIRVNAEDKGREIIISVTDHGIGIPKESLSKIFDRFYRVDESRTKTTGGTGLGLSIAKQIIQYHEGRISAESKLGEGTKINIYLPKLI